MPGVQKGSEGQTGIYVRGGGPDQNLIILDEATVYNASHLFGFFSAFFGFDSTFSTFGLAASGGFGAAGGLVLGLLFSTYTQASLPWLDSMLASFSLVASYWAARKYIESWAMWCVLDALYVLMYLHKSLNLTAFLYFIFILLALNGWRMWKSQWKTGQQAAAQL